MVPDDAISSLCLSSKLKHTHTHTSMCCPAVRFAAASASGAMASHCCDAGSLELDGTPGERARERQGGPVFVCF